MPRFDYKLCRKCGKPSSEVGPLSHTRQCQACGERDLVENVRGLHTMSGPVVTRWRQGMAASVGALLLDDLAELVQTADHA